MLKLETKNLTVEFRDKVALKNVNPGIERNAVTALIGPAGCGKTTFLRLFNRMNEQEEPIRLTGQVLLDGADIYAEKDPFKLRQKVGMVAGKPALFPGSVFDNVAFAPRLINRQNLKEIDEKVETALYRAELWDETKDLLHKPAYELSEGRQQRLCIARALAADPSVLLLDEPTARLDPVSSAKIEQLIDNLRRHLTIVIVTHNLQQAARLSDAALFFWEGELVEQNATKKMFTQPANPRTQNYLTGRHE